MQSHELVKEVLQKISAKQVAGEMGLSLSLIYKWAEPAAEGSGAANPLDRVEQLLKLSGDRRLAKWVCERAGGFFIANPKANPQAVHLIPATNSIVEEFADMLAVIARAATDNTITREEARDIRGRWEELKSVTEGFVRCCEAGNFAPVHQHLADRARTA
jgi:transcriptional regulator with XRE-family HTH domain